jgi:molybdate transport system substrate-binding protein
VLAASSLATSFQALATQFEASHPGVTVEVVLGSSAILAQQVQQGAPGDVLATADQRTMTAAAGSVGTPTTFASNKLVLAVPSDNPAGITSVDDLEKPAVTYVVCVPEAPCGALSQTALTTAHITHPPASLETDVQAVVTKLESGNADAGLVYATDVAASGGKLTAISLPSAVRTDYYIATIDRSGQQELAGAFVDFVESAAGQQVLAAQGFTSSG